MMFIQHSVNSDWLLNTQSRVLQADWFILEINEKATLNIDMPYWLFITQSRVSLSGSVDIREELGGNFTHRGDV